MQFADAVRTVLSRYSDFHGRSRRSEYWYWTLAVTLVYVVASLVDVASHVLGVLLIVVLLLAILVPSLAVAIRRLHDTGRSGWWLILGVVPFLGLVTLVFQCQNSHPGPNRYGPCPK